MSSDELELNDGMEEEEDEEDPEPVMNENTKDGEKDTNGGRKRRSSRGNVSYKEVDDGDLDDDEEGSDLASRKEEEEGDDDDDDDSDDDDDDDDVPLASLKNKSSSPPKKEKNALSAKSANKNGSKTKTKKSSTPSLPKKKKTPSSSSTSSKPAGTNSTSSNSEYASPSFALYGSESKKGEIIQKLLCRWWYAITWPDPSTLPDKPPPNYDAMDGFPGVYVCTKGEEVGTIKDLRDKSKAPNFNNFAKMTSEELRTLLVKAIEEQKRQLVAKEGTGTGTEKELNSILKWAEKLNCDKADKEAVKVLRAANLSLPE